MFTVYHDYLNLFFCVPDCGIKIHVAKWLVDKSEAQLNFGFEFRQFAAHGFDPHICVYNISYLCLPFRFSKLL